MRGLLDLGRRTPVEDHFPNAIGEVQQLRRWVEKWKPAHIHCVNIIVTFDASLFEVADASPPNPSWGTLLKSGRAAIEQMWWLILFPGTAIFLTVLAYNLIGEGLQEATDPRLRQPQ